MSHNIIAPTLAFFLSHKLAVVNLFEQTLMVGIRHSVATATAFLKTTLPVKEGRFRFISHKFTASNLFCPTRHMNNRSYVIARTPPFLDQGTGLIVASATIVCRVSEANRTRQRTSVRDNLRQSLTNPHRAYIQRTYIVHTVSNKRCTKYRIHFGANNHANCRGKITPTAVVYNVHTLYIHIWILPLSAKLVHSELLLTHKLATVNLWLLIAAYEQSLICYRTRQANIHTFLAHITENIC